MRSRLTALALVASAAAQAFPSIGQSQLLRVERHDVSAPLWLLRPVEAAPPRLEREPLRVPLPQWPVLARDSVLQERPPSLLLMPQPGLSFEGIGEDFVGAQGTAFKIIGDPPDPQGDVGPSHYLQIVNASIAAFSKQGTLLFGPVPTRTVFAGFGGPCEASDEGDGIVLYDRTADRWLVTQLAIADRSSGPFLECIAVSRGLDPTGSYARYSYSYPFFNDYPKLGIWSDA